MLWHIAEIWNPHTHKTHMLKVQVVSPVEQINEDEGEREGQTWVVVNIVWVFHMATIQKAHNAAQQWQGLGAATLGLGGKLLFFSVTGRGTASTASTGQHLLPFAYPQSLAANGRDDPIHLILTFLHLLSILTTNEETWKSSVDTIMQSKWGVWNFFKHNERVLTQVLVQCSLDNDGDEDAAESMKINYVTKTSALFTCRHRLIFIYLFILLFSWPKMNLPVLM